MDKYAVASQEAVAGVIPHPIFLALDSAYELGKRLGRGCFATVYKARRRLDDAAVAVKVVEKKRLDVDTAKLLQNELEVLQAVSEHPGIVTLLDSIETDTHMYFIMEYVDGGPLLDRIVSKGNFSENDARVILRAILQTLDYLNHLGCVHRDIKPENILVDNHSKKWPVKLTDFGLSAKMQPDELLYGTLGTPLFVAPEILKGEGYDCSCDMWSLGVVLYLVLCGYPPFPYKSPKELVSAIIHGQYSFPAPEWVHVSDDAKDALTMMMEVDPKRRITPVGALKHPWFRAVQSTSDLPNSKLKSFNARRKLRASMFVVRTTFDFMKFLDKGTSLSQKEKRFSQDDLLQAVENSRRLIQKMDIAEGTAPRSDSDNTPRERPSFESSKALSRRSLVLPNGITESYLSQASDISPVTEGRILNEATNRGFGLRSSETAPWNSQVMSSRAKALVAEMRGSSISENSGNPFLVTVQKPHQEKLSGTLQGQQLRGSRKLDLCGNQVTSEQRGEVREKHHRTNSTENSAAGRLPHTLVRLDFEDFGIL